VSEFLHVERPFLDQLANLGWRVIDQGQGVIPSGPALSLVEAKRYWIYKSLAEWRDLNATRVLRECRNGEGFLYLGRAYRLLLVADQAEPCS
jgi:hypothetical protein